jgi:hypothetical protein
MVKAMTLRSVGSRQATLERAPAGVVVVGANVVGANVVVVGANVVVGRSVVDEADVVVNSVVVVQVPGAVLEGTWVG